MRFDLLRVCSPVRVGKRPDSEKTDAGISIAEIKEVKARAEY
jgi:hypothetical protein